MKVLTKMMTGGKEPLAKKYCFRATVKIFDKHRVPVAVIFSYDNKPTISRTIEKLAEEFCMEHAQDEYQYDESEMVMYPECPTELNGDIHFQMIREI